MYRQLLNSNLFPISELSVKFASQICHENINKPLDGAYLADFGIEINQNQLKNLKKACILLLSPWK